MNKRQGDDVMNKQQMIVRARQLEASAHWLARMAGRKMLELLNGGPAFEGWTWAERKRSAMKWIAEGAAQERALWQSGWSMADRRMR